MRPFRRVSQRLRNEIELAAGPGLLGSADGLGTGCPYRSTSMALFIAITRSFIAMILGSLI
jgi:hypothetical protein